MTVRRRVTAKSTVLMRRHSAGSTWANGSMVVPVAKRLGCRYQRTPSGPGWLMPAGVTDDFEALATHLGLTVEWVIL